MNIKILVDPEIFFSGRCGLVRYYSKLIDLLEKESNITFDIPLLLSGSDMIVGKYQTWRKLLTHLPLGMRLINKANAASKRLYWKKIEKGEYDLLLITSPIFEDNFLNFIPKIKPRPFLMVVHDTMQCILGPDSLFDLAGDNTDKLAYLSSRATKAICISNTTQADLIRMVGKTLVNTEVILTGNLLDPVPDQSPKCQLPQRYLLFVGERTGRKNFRKFIQAITPILLEQSDLKVICTKPLTKFELDFIRRLDIVDSILHIDAPDAVLNHLYKKAVALVYPSLYEGFGLPVLEAMSIGCPVITSNISALTEVGNDAVIYINPYNTQSIFNAVCLVTSPMFNRDEYVEKGFLVAAAFTPKIMSEEFIKLFKEVILTTAT